MVIKRSSTVPPVPSHLEKWGGARAPRAPWFRRHCSYVDLVFVPVCWILRRESSGYTFAITAQMYEVF